MKGEVQSIAFWEAQRIQRLRDTIFETIWIRVWSLRWPGVRWAYGQVRIRVRLLNLYPVMSGSTEGGGRKVWYHWTETEPKPSIKPLSIEFLCWIRNHAPIEFSSPTKKCFA